MAYSPPTGKANLSLQESITRLPGPLDLNIGSGYVPPVGTVNLFLEGEYIPPTGTVDLALGYAVVASDDRQVVIAAKTAGARAAVIGYQLKRVIVAAKTGGARAAIDVAYDPNLLSDVILVRPDLWQEGLRKGHCADLPYEESAPLRHSSPETWQPATPQRPGSQSRWQPSTPLNSAGADVWQDADLQQHANDSRWQDSQALRQAQTADTWQETEQFSGARTINWHNLPRLTIPLQAVHQDGPRIGTCYEEGFRDGDFLSQPGIEVWQPAGYPGNAVKPKPTKPPPIRFPWGTDLQICRELPGTALKIAAAPCPNQGWWNVPVRRMYRVINSASLVRLPDMTPLPVLSMTIETDSKSWCWALSATLFGRDAWDLVEPVGPAYLPWEVQATINGYTWQFLLDIPNRSQKFNNNRVSIAGRSRSAWLDAPYDRQAIGYNAYDRTANQLAEEVLENTGWTLDWQIEDWLVPAKRWERDNTKIGALKRLVNPVRGLIYTDPALSVLTVYSEYKVASWLWDAEIPDVTIPEAATLGWTQKPDFKTSYNAVYVSGTTHGVLAFVKIAGTDGALSPGQPIVEALCCDTNGVAARMRGLAELSAGGPGYKLSADLFLTEYGDLNGPGLIAPGMMVQLAGLQGVARSVSITAQWSDVLRVRQAIEVERKEDAD